MSALSVKERNRRLVAILALTAGGIFVLAVVGILTLN
jgi:hypothetical protein